MATYNGTNNNDSLIYSNSITDDFIYGYDGDDTIRAGSGNDYISGGNGNDILYGGAGNDQLSGGMGNDILIGGLGNDNLNGSAGDDILNGGAGSDTLAGSFGNDIFVHNVAENLVAYDFYDGDSGDPSINDRDTLKLNFTRNFLDSVTSNVKTYFDAIYTNFESQVTPYSYSIISLSSTQTIQASAIENILVNINDPVTAHFNGMLLRDTSTGAMSIFQEDTIGNSTSIMNLSLSWTVAAIADFDHDGQSDLLVRNYSSVGGQNQIFLMNNNANIKSIVSLPLVSDPHWIIEGASDFNNDGNIDILWRNSATGDNCIWEMNSSYQLQQILSLYNISPTSGWQMEGMGDFNGDGIGDIYWRNSSTGENSIWTMNVAGQFTSTPVLVFPEGAPSLSYQMLGIADYNHDGFLDTYWRNNTTGDGFVYLMHNLTVLTKVDNVYFDIIPKTIQNAQLMPGYVTQQSVSNGTTGNDTITGTSGPDVLHGGLGNDTMTGGTGADKFVYQPAGGADTITDFKFADHDKIDLTAFNLRESSADSDADVMAKLNITSTGANSAVIDFGSGNTLTVLGLDGHALVAGDFVF